MVANFTKKAAAGSAAAFKTAERTEKQLRLKSLTWVDVGVLWGFYLVVVAAAPVRSAYFGVAYNWQQISNSKLAEFVGLKADSTDVYQGEIGKGEQKLKVGDQVAGFDVSSARGRRDIGDGGEMHEGVDLAVPVGTPLYAPAAVLLKCWVDGSGGGNVAEFVAGGYTHKFLHLSACTPGNYQPGDRFAFSGGEPGAPGAGRTTGPHLDYRMQKGGQWAEPSRKLLTAVMSGQVIGLDSDFTSRYKQAIASQESGQSYTATNPNSRAMGKYQFMPDTAELMAKQCGLTYTGAAAFLANAQLQEQMMDCYIESSSADGDSDYLRCRKLASDHYSGDPEKYGDRSRQTYNGAEYPSIDTYTKSVCQEFN